MFIFIIFISLFSVCLIWFDLIWFFVYLQNLFTFFFTFFFNPKKFKVDINKTVILFALVNFTSIIIIQTTYILIYTLILS